MNRPFTERQQKILELLTRFKYLTVSQMLALNIAKHASNLRLSLSVFVDAGYIDKLTFATDPRVGKLEYFYCLTKKGVDILSEVYEPIYPSCAIKYPKSSNNHFSRDYNHRKITIDFHVAFFQWTLKNHIDVAFVDYYFDTVGANSGHERKSAPLISKNQLFIQDTYRAPDIIAKINGADRDYLFMVEMHCGYDTGRLYKQILWHAALSSAGKAQEKYNYKRGIKIYIVLEHTSMVENIAKRMQQSPELAEYKPFFLFKSLDSLKEDFFSGWMYYDGQIDNFIS
mgnify:CR=1 FL=1